MSNTGSSVPLNNFEVFLVSSSFNTPVAQRELRSWVSEVGKPTDQKECSGNRSEMMQDLA